MTNFKEIYTTNDFKEDYNMVDSFLVPGFWPMVAGPFDDRVIFAVVNSCREQHELQYTDRSRPFSD